MSACGSTTVTGDGRGGAPGPEELFEEPVHLTIEYREPIERRVEVDRVIKVGL